MNSAAVLALLGDLYAQVADLTAQVQRLTAALEAAEQPEPDDS